VVRAAIAHQEVAIVHQEVVTVLLERRVEEMEVREGRSLEWDQRQWMLKRSADES
jgi:DNA recombination-dependent growth factor C